MNGERAEGVNRELETGSHSDDDVRHVTGWRAVVLWPLSILLRIWCATIRVSIPPDEEKHLGNTDEPMVVMFWHNRLLFSAAIHRRYRRSRGMCGLVSASGDGAWLAAFFRVMGIGSVRGSSSSRTVASTRQLIERLKSGDDVAITPDGPRGPLYDFKPGAWRLAEKTGAPVLLVSGRFRRACRLNSWDGFYIPCPFTTAEMRVIYVGKEISRDDLSEDERGRSLYRMLMSITDDGGRD